MISHYNVEGKTDQSLLNCGCGECKSEMAYRDYTRRHRHRPAQGEQMEMFPTETLAPPPEDDSYEDIPARIYSS